MKFKVPEQLESERLILRQFQDADWQDLHQYYSDEAATAFTYHRGLTEGETWRTMCSMIGHWQVRGYGPYAVEERSIGVAIAIGARLESSIEYEGEPHGIYRHKTTA